MTEPAAPLSADAHLDHMNDTGPWVWPAWLFMVIVAATVIEIVARYFVAAPTIWANELTLFVCSKILGPYAHPEDPRLEPARRTAEQVIEELHAE